MEVNRDEWSENGAGMKKTLYISDLDGTLLNKAAVLSEYTTNSLNALMAKGLNFSIATARTLASIGNILDGLTLSSPMVLMNGVLIYDVCRKRYLTVDKLLPDAVDSVILALREYEITGFMYEFDDGEIMTYHDSPAQSQPLPDFVQERIDRYRNTYRHTDSYTTMSRSNIVYIVLHDTYERLTPVYNAFAALPGVNRAFYHNIYTPDMWYLEISNANASKQSAVAFLRENCGFERVIGFGDNLNDLPMFAACDTRVAVANAKEEVKVAADYICGDNDNDGVVKWIENNYAHIPSPKQTANPIYDKRGDPGESRLIQYDKS